MTEFLNPTEKLEIRQTVAAAKQGLDSLVADFYHRLFELEPSLRPLFAADLSDQKKKLLTMLVSIVGLLDQPDKLIGAARVLGQRHTGYGVATQDFEVVGEALLGALSAAVGDEAWTYQRQEAWTRLYGTLAQEMIAQFH
jgi:hemoglobin-like flavoprotein